MDDALDRLSRCEPRRLAALMESGAEEARVWQPDELGAIWRHQLQAPLRFDLAAAPAPRAAQLVQLAEARGLVLRGLGALLRHPAPPVDLLRLTKDFARACSVGRDAALPRELAQVLYYAAIVAALVRCRQRITRLSNDELAEGLRWALAQPWLDEDTRKLLSEGQAAIESGGRAS